MARADLGTSTLDMEVLSMDVDTLHSDVEESLYRLRVGSQVKYITIEPGTFPSDVLSFPMDLLPLLPNMPPGNWVEARVARDSNENPTVQPTNATLPEVREQWHPNKVDALSLPFVKFMTPRVRVVQYASRPVVSKIARFDFEIPRMERETAAYRAIDGYGVSPAFLGHIVEGDRVIGFLVEQLHGRPAGPEDLQGCRDVLQRLHALDIIHGDPNKHNFIVASDGTVTLIDFENAMFCKSTEQKNEELATLPAQLSEMTGRGGVVMRKLVY
ncbi:alpha-galactosidase A [Suillus bovinus]|uniref:alpha-galactosidase A n=1 Tax=Suillus bovinus TaxID=48563 RepID=UPI001B861F7C|nr:alpha-galactosidase A [Suillus bovinus]KAG2135734.1 alpha-galactosidase A [Suillus bovinus]